MNKGIIIAGFGAIGKTTLAKKYKNIIDMESGLYQWDYESIKDIPYEETKGMKNKKVNEKWPNNYYAAIKNAQNNYDIVLTLISTDILRYYEKNQMEYYIAYPALDMSEELKKRCLNRGNKQEFVEQLLFDLKDFYPRMLKFNYKKLLIINRNEYLEDVLKREKLI